MGEFNDENFSDEAETDSNTSCSPQKSGEQWACLFYRGALRVLLSQGVRTTIFAQLSPAVERDRPQNLMQKSSIKDLARIRHVFCLGIDVGGRNL